MRVCVVGGIFGRPRWYRSLHPHAPETVLARGLAALGVEVVTRGHDAFLPDDRFDLVHVHHLGRAAYLAAVSPTRAPFVFTGHDGQMLCGHGQGRGRVRREAFRYVLSRSDAAVALGAAEARFLRALGHPRVEVIPNGVPALFGRAPLDLPREGILYVGQLVPLKGVDVLLHAMARLRHGEARLALAYHNAALEPALAALARALGVAERVRFLGALSPEALAERYARAELVVLPSHAESLPSVVTEALLAGTPVVATRVGGIPDQLGPHGALVAPGDAGALAAAIDAALDVAPGLALRQRMRARAEARYGGGAMAARHLALYEATLAHGPRRRGRGLLDPALRAAISTWWSRPAAATAAAEA